MLTSGPSRPRVWPLPGQTFLCHKPAARHMFYCSATPANTLVNHPGCCATCLSLKRRGIWICKSSPPHRGGESFEKQNRGGYPLRSRFYVNTPVNHAGCFATCPFLKRRGIWSKPPLTCGLLSTPEGSHIYSGVSYSCSTPKGSHVSSGCSINM